MELKNIKAAFFDLDGTLIDTEKIYVKCWKKAGDICGFPMEMDRVYTLRSTDHQLATEKFANWYGDEEAYPKIRAKRKELMAEVLKHEPIVAKPGVREIVDFFESRGIKVAVVTASTVEVADDFMKKAGIREYFETIISARGVKRGKPFPYVYEYAAQFMKLDPSECIAFEDSQNGIMSAKSAGVHTVFIPDLTPMDETVSEYTDETYDSLLEFVKKHK